MNKLSYKGWMGFSCVALSALSFQSNAGTLTLGVGVDYASGDYGEPTTTRDLFVPFSLSYKEGAWRGKLVLPFSAITGNGEVVGAREDRTVDDRRGSNSGPGGGGSSGNSGKGSQDDSQERLEDSNLGTSSQSGLGDASASLTYSAIANEDRGLFLDLTARVKFGTASDSKGLGSGENDYAALVDVDKEIGKFTFSAGAGYWFIGSPPGFDYRNVVSGLAGVSYRLSDALSVNSFLNFRQSVRSGAPDQLDITPGLVYRVDEKRRVSAYVLFGLADGSPDIGAGIAYTHSF